MADVGNLAHHPLGGTMESTKGSRPGSFALLSSGIVLLWAVTGCSSGDVEARSSIEPTQQSLAAESPTPTIASTPTSTSPEPSETAPTAEVLTVQEGLTPIGHFLFDNRSAERDEPWVRGATTYIFPGQSVMELDAEALFPDREILSQVYTSAGPDSEPIIAGAIQHRKAASGLQEQKYLTTLVALDPATQEVLSETELFSQDSETMPVRDFIGSQSNVVAFSHGPFNSDEVLGEERDEVTAYDALTGKEVWNIIGGSSAPVHGALTVSDWLKGECGQSTGVDVTTGKHLFQVVYRGDSVGCLNTGPYARIPGAAVERIAEHQRYVRINMGQERKDEVFDARTGRESHLPDLLLEVDPLGDVVAGYPMQSTRPLEFMDSKTGKVLWSLAPEKVANLDASVERIYGDKAYIKTTDGVTVVDARTGDELEQDPASLPMGAVGQWTYWSDWTLRTD